MPDPLLCATEEDTWRYRRRVLFVSLIWMGILMTWILIRGVDNALNGQAFVALAGGFVALLMGYIFGAVWDDHNRRSAYSTFGEDQGATWQRTSPEKPQPPQMP